MLSTQCAIVAYIVYIYYIAYMDMNAQSLCAYVMYFPMDSTLPLAVF